MIYLLYVTALLNVLLGFFTFLTGRRHSRSSLYFFLVCLGIGGWAVANAQFQISITAEEMHLWAIIAYQIAAFMLFVMVLFCHSITAISSSTKARSLSILCLTFGLLVPLFPGVISKGVNFANKSIIAGPLLPVLFLTYLVLIVNTVLTLRAGVIKAKGLKRVQLRYVSIGMIGAIIAGVITNLVLPAFSIYAAVALGPSFTLIMLGLISYTIARHRLFDVRVIVGRTLYYLLLMSFPYALFFALVFIYTRIFGTVFTLPVYLVSIPVGLSYVIFFNTFNDYIRTQINSRLINPGYDPLSILDKLSNELGIMIDLGSTANHLIETVAHTIRPEYSTILLVSEKNRSKRLFTDSTFRNFIAVDFLADSVVSYFNNQDVRIFIADEMEADVDDPKPQTEEVAHILEQMRAIGAKVILGLGRQEITSLYIIGEKEGDAFYTAQDIEFLKSVTNAGTLAIERSLLYSEVQEFANTLQKKVDEATEELLRTNRNLEQTLTQLQEVRRQERDMLDVMGHELRTPISIVRNALLMLDRETSSNKLNPEDYKKYLAMSIESVRREITLIETLLSATKIDASRLQLYYVKADIKDVVNDAMEAQKQAAAQKNIPVVYIPSAEEEFAYADRTRAQEVVDNFLSNAVKYTNVGQVTIYSWVDAQHCWVQIKDSGIGISADDLQNLGKKFFRAKQYITGSNSKEANIVRPGGTGLGLYVTFDLIRIMGGTLYINSQIGEGSTFTFSLPRYTGQPDKQVDQTFASDSSLNRQEHVLLNQQAPQPPQASQ